MEKPKRVRLDWSTAKYDYCGCGAWANVIDGRCAQCYDDAYALEVEDFYESEIKRLEDAPKVVLSTIAKPTLDSTDPPNRSKMFALEVKSGDAWYSSDPTEDVEPLLKTEKKLHSEGYKARVVMFVTTREVLVGEI